MKEISSQKHGFLKKKVHLTRTDKSIKSKMNHLGETLRKLREDKGLLLRQAAAFIEVDTAFVSKLERGERKAQKEQVLKLAEFLKTPSDELLILWMADRINEVITDKSLGIKALEIVKKDMSKK